MVKKQTVTPIDYDIRKHRNLITVGAFSPIVSIGNPVKNAETILNDIVTDSRLMDCELVVTPELSLTGYTCQDMFFNTDVLKAVPYALHTLYESLPDGMLLSVGAPLCIDTKVFNCSILLSNEGIISITPKTYLANYAEFYEDRWFTSYKLVNKDKQYDTFGYNVVRVDGQRYDGYAIGSEICEDLWAPDAVSTHMAIAGATVLVNNSASNETVGKARFRRDLVKMQSAKTISAYIYCSAGMSESTQDVVFGGHNIIAENGKILAESELFDLADKGVVVATINLDALIHDRRLNKTFSTYSESSLNINVIDIESKPKVHEMDKVYRTVSTAPFVPSGRTNPKLRCKEIFDMQVAGLTSRLIRTGSKHIVVGVSGGLDSTLALLVAHEAVLKAGKPESCVLGVTMPCFGTTSRTKENAIKLMKALNCTIREVDISKSVTQHLEDIGISMDDRSVAFENAQARERTQVLMDIANKEGGFVLGTGDMSELALGWCTYNGDHMSMYNVNGSIPKTLVRLLVGVIGEMMIESKEGRDTIKDILDTPVSPELLPPKANGDIAQLTEDSVGPYVFNDFFMYYHVRYGFTKDKILGMLEIACKQDNVDFSKAEYWLGKFYERFYRAQFKRNVCPDGVKVGSVSLNPRGDWRCPSEFDGSTHYSFDMSIY